MKKIIALVASALMFFALLGSLGFETTKAEVQLSTNKETKTVRTHAGTVEDLLNDQGIKVEPHDALSHNLNDTITSGMNIDYQSAKQITVKVDGNTQQYYTTADTVQQLFKAEGISIKERDKVSHEQASSLKDGMEIQVQKAFKVALNDGGETSEIWTTANTVNDFLKQQAISLNELDRLKQKESASLSKDQNEVTITRVEKVTDVVEETVDYAVVKRNDKSLAKGKEKVVQNGEEGQVVKQYEVTLENGEEVDRKLVKEESKKDSKDKIVAIGTKVQQVQSSQPQISRSNSSSGVQKTLYMHATAYTAYCAGCSGVTSTGINLRANPNQKVIAVDPNVIPLGSKVWVEGYGYAIAGDQGSAIKGNRIDLFMSSKSAANSFGRRNVQVKVYGK
ncbi:MULTISPECIES: G5 and 3D domain-containing protein [Pontibacillus]|uniref:Ubiquitin-like domain-containing protein n=1 Tax=Pontibacillus chungwhensis TaxID=265426 RepID=A0ABY8V070_9BACI|nr:G5 and 3D domain-containing protein [Pontibacillus chungwhensis]MCD5326088.1 ubiquitin-like domain-containing protein [Pontibacillus sp. HN14]WIF98189.1 ubiquitin-like domain-containing protein [Pontibacillus chungwhensis]